MNDAGADNSPPLQRLSQANARVGLILGSGLNSVVAGDTNPAVAYSEFKEIPNPSVPGHAGRFVIGQIEQAPVIFAQGRVHLYEGHSAHDVTAIVRILAAAGVKILIVTNAAGSANPDFAPGNWLMIRDHLNLTGTTPLLGRQTGSGSAGPQFLDMTEAYSARLRNIFAGAAAETDTLLHHGVYAGLLGPQYETPAEVRMLQKLGADAIGMSTVLEVIQAHALGLEIAGFSCLTNLAAGIAATHLSHQEVLETGRQAADSFLKLLRVAFPKL